MNTTAIAQTAADQHHDADLNEAPVVVDEDAIRLLDELAQEDIAKLASAVWSDLTPQARVMFEHDDIVSEIYVIIYEMRAGFRRCNLVEDGNTLGYLRILVKRELTKRGRLIDVESDRSRDSSAVLASKAAARNVMAMSVYTEGESGSTEAVDHMVDTNYVNVPETPDQVIEEQQDNLLLDLIRDEMPITTHLLETGDPNTLPVKMTRTERRRAIFGELVSKMPWMAAEESREYAKQIAEDMASKRGPRGPYKKRAPNGPRWKRQENTHGAVAVQVGETIIDE